MTSTTITEAAGLPTVDSLSSQVLTAAGILVVTAFVCGFAWWAISSKWGRAIALGLACAVAAGLIFVPNGAKDFLLEIAKTLGIGGA